MFLRLVLFVIITIITHPAIADVVTGKVIKIADGDTLTIIKNKYKFKIRLLGIDAPETDQPHGDIAKKALTAIVFKKTVRIEFNSFDDYNRVLGTVYLDTMDVNAEMIKNGHAWVYRQYTDDKQLYHLEDLARENQLGLWALSADQRIPPWDWRKKSRGTRLDKKPNPVDDFFCALFGVCNEPAPKSQPKPVQTDTSPDNDNPVNSCGPKKYCGQMTDCNEAMYYFKSCNLMQLDVDNDGVPCESLCR